MFKRSEFRQPVACNCFILKFWNWHGEWNSTWYGRLSGRGRFQVQTIVFKPIHIKILNVNVSCVKFCSSSTIFWVWKTSHSCKHFQRATDAAMHERKVLHASQCSDLLDSTRASCWIFAQHQPNKLAAFRSLVLTRVILNVSASFVNPARRLFVVLWSHDSAPTKCAPGLIAWAVQSTSESRSPNKYCKIDFHTQNWREVR